MARFLDFRRNVVPHRSGFAREVERTNAVVSKTDARDGRITEFAPTEAPITPQNSSSKSKISSGMQGHPIILFGRSAAQRPVTSMN
jgi:hypothetical protein